MPTTALALPLDDASLATAFERDLGDQDGRGALLVIPYGGTFSTFPVRALLAWRSLAAIEMGPLFVAVTRGGRLTAHDFRRGHRLDRAAPGRRGGVEGDVAGHSLRAGFSTTAADNGVPMVDSMAQSRHRSITVAAGYVTIATPPAAVTAVSGVLRSPATSRRGD